MPDAVQKLQAIRPGPIEPPPLRTAAVRRPEGQQSFTDTLSETITEVQRLQNEADTAVKQLVAGEVKDVTDAMVAVEKADVAFQTMMQVRNKMLTAYQEVMRMNV